MKHEESTIQTQCVRWFRYQYPSRTIFSIPLGGNRNAVTGAILKAEGALAGVADLQILHAAHGYHGLFIEMKTRTGRQQPSQIAFQVKAESEGYKYAVCRSFDDFEKVVNEYFKK